MTVSLMGESAGGVMSAGVGVGSSEWGPEGEWRSAVMSREHKGGDVSLPAVVR